MYGFGHNSDLDSESELLDIIRLDEPVLIQYPRLPFHKHWSVQIDDIQCEFEVD